MKFSLVYVIALVALSANEILSSPLKKKPKKGGKDGDKFCKNKTLSDGRQLAEGSCSLTIQGDIPSNGKMTSTLIISPENNAKLDANKPFSVDILIDNLDTGHFSDPETEYNVKPQTLDDDGLIIGHTHVTIQKLTGKKPPNAKEFEFFKGLDTKANSDGLLTVQVIRDDNKPGLDAGTYRICTMAGSFTHQPLVMPVAKRGAQDDCIRIKVSECKDDKKEKGKGKY